MQKDTDIEFERLLTTAEVKLALCNFNSDYGKDFSDEEWEQITERLCALAQLFWRLATHDSYQEKVTFDPNTKPLDEKQQLRGPGAGY